MIYPQNNSFRQFQDLSGFWDFRLDPKDSGLSKGWSKGFPQDRLIAVPSSWNDQYQDTRDYLGPAWYQTRFDLPWGFKDKHLSIRFGSVNYLAQVWLNGTKLGEHEGGHLPFVLETTPHLKPKDNLLVVRVEGLLAPNRVPPGNVPPDPKDRFNNFFNPPASFDFFPYCGIHRPVLLVATPQTSIQDITVITDISGKTGAVKVEVATDSSQSLTARFCLTGFDRKVIAVKAIGPGKTTALLSVPNARLWAPGSPNLYQLKVEMVQNNEIIDQIDLPVGIRTIRVKGSRFLLNGKPIHLRGFGRHEDFPVTGRHLPAAVVVKDYELMKWVGANSFRTSHYPYSEEILDLADRMGFLVIDETPAVGLFFNEEGLGKRLELCRQYTQELIDRDKNHPSVILWSLANEPHSHRPAARGFFKNLADLARSLDKTRPITLASYIGLKEEAFQFLDAVCVNRYFGWYSEEGDLDKACEKLPKDMETIHRRFQKPLILTEFGADAIPGHHAEPPEMFSEEYQAEMIERYLKVLDKLPYVAGAHIWNLCDFKTAQAPHRPGAMNWKGVFTRDRRPKLAAHVLRKQWRKLITGH